MINPAKYMRKIKDVQVAYDSYSPQGSESWESVIMKDDKSANKVIDDLYRLMRTADISVWQRCHNDLSTSVMLGFRDKRLDLYNKAMLLEIDDDALNVNAENQASQVFYPGSDMTDMVKDQLSFASGLIVSTEYLKRLYSEYNPYIEVIPNGIDFEIWGKLVKPIRVNKKVRIGWAGSSAHEEDMKIISKVIPVILNKYKDVEFMFFGHASSHIKYNGYNVLHHRNSKGHLIWNNIADYPQELANLNFDIGIAPLRDNSFNRAKSNLRFLEYAALGIPTVASNIEPFKNTKSDGLMKVTETEDWIEALSILIEHEAKRKTIGRIAYRDVKRDYNIKDIADKYVDILRKFHSGKLKSQIRDISPEMFDKTKRINREYGIYQ
jgi:glycosyltransferase involved in cell wall biosynthesis